jgi:hypothetical protein
MDHLEKFISENREAFDTEIPNLKLWAEIEKQVNPPSYNKIVRMNWVRNIAAAIALLVIGAGVGITLNEKREVIVANSQMEQVVPEFKEAEQFYNQQVQDKLTKLANYNPDPTVTMDLQQIDAVQQELKAELEKAPSSTREEIIERMIENYKIKLGILERVLEHIEQKQIQNQKSKQHDSI